MRYAAFGFKLRVIEGNEGETRYRLVRK